MQKENTFFFFISERNLSSAEPKSRKKILTPQRNYRDLSTTDQLHTLLQNGTIEFGFCHFEQALQLVCAELAFVVGNGRMLLLAEVKQAGQVVGAFLSLFQCFLIAQRQLAERFSISRSYVSRIEKRALEKLRDALGDGIELP